MKKKTFQINIPKPCNENWSEMTPTQFDARFCSQCEKNVIDFTNQSEREIKAAYDKANGKICGRFRTSQLGKDYQLAPPPKSNLHLKAAGLLLSGLLTANTVAAQTSVKSPIQIEEVFTNDKQEPSKEKSTVIIKGKVIDQNSQKPLTFTTIAVLNSTIQTATDLNGEFVIETTLPIRLQVVHSEYETQVINISELPKKILTINLKSVHQEMMSNFSKGEIVIGKPLPPKN